MVDRRSIGGGAASVALHVALAWVVVNLVGEDVRSPPYPPGSTVIEVVDAAPGDAPAAPPQTTPVTPPKNSSPVTRARRQQALRPQPAAPVPAQGLGELAISYDDPTDLANKPATSNESPAPVAPSGIRTSIANAVGDGLASMAIPQTPVVSRARPPRPRFDYNRLRLARASKFAGRTIKLMLRIDTRGRVHEVRLLQSVDRELDRRTIALARTFEFDPALDDEGVPARANLSLALEIIEDEDAAPFETAH